MSRTYIKNALIKHVEHEVDIIALEKKQRSERLRVIRKKLGLSIKEFAELVNMEARTIEGWEQDRRTPDYIRMLGALRR